MSITLFEMVLALTFISILDPLCLGLELSHVRLVVRPPRFVRLLCETRNVPSAFNILEEFEAIEERA